jgi:CHASE3 domain sensor protein
VHALKILRVTLLINLIVTVAAMTMAYRAMRRSVESGRLVISSHRTLQAAEETLRRAVDAETGARGFMLTHHAADLQRYRLGQQFAVRPLNELSAILAADGRQAAADGVRIALDTTLEHLNRLVQLATDGDRLQDGESDAARASMDALRTAIRAIRQTENDVLTDRIQRLERADRRVNWLLIGMTGLATALLVLFVASLIIVTRPGLWRT